MVQSQDDGQLHQHTADDVLRALLLSAGGRTVGGGEGDGDAAKIGAKPFWSINYQDFVADVRGLDSGRPYCTETFRLVVSCLGCIICMHVADNLGMVSVSGASALIK